jgi:alpha-glucosidase
VLLFSLRGTTVMYAGQELGLQDADVPPERVVDPGGRDGCRAPIPWESGPARGWATADTWLPWPPSADRLNVAEQSGDPDSTLHLYRELLQERRGSAALRRGAQKLLHTPEGVLGFAREEGRDRRRVLVNFTAAEVPAPLDGNWRIAVDSTGPSAGGAAYGGRLGPDQAVVLRPQ